MLQKFLLMACVLAIAMGIVVVPFPYGATAIGFVFLLSAILILVFRKYTDEKEFITTVFLVALALRIGFGLFIYIFELNSFFGGDDVAYDKNGAEIADYWSGVIASSRVIENFNPRSGAAWGMDYIVAAIYFVFGRNFFAAQSFFGVVGAATSPLVFFLSRRLFNNLRVAKLSAIFIAAYPPFIIWSGQMLKDGMIICLLVLAMTMVLELQKKLSYSAVMALVLSMFGILTLRFYIFYMVAVAVASSFVLGFSGAKTFLRNAIILVLVSMALWYLGVSRTASIELEAFGSLERVQISRQALRTANSGYEDTADVSTTEGALSAIPMGLVYLMLAPFPWQASNLRQAITIPEVLMWWGLIPFMFVGLYYAVRYRLQAAFPVLMFSLMLTLGYALFQGNVGTAYRQRTQIQVFLFILISAGWVIYQESRENKRLLRLAAQQRLDARIRGQLTPQNVPTELTPHKV